MSAGSTGWEHVYRVVRRIPAGRVASYGQVAALAGMPRAARQVGYALHALDAESTVPWHRVVNALGEIALRDPRESVPLQRARLEAEGVDFTLGGRIDWARFGWRPRAARPTGTSSREPVSPKGSSRPTRGEPGRPNRRKSRGSKA